MYKNVLLRFVFFMIVYSIFSALGIDKFFEGNCLWHLIANGIAIGVVTGIAMGVFSIFFPRIFRKNK